MIPSNARHNIDGSITFPCRGIAPTCNEPGYIEDPNDPFRWIMIYCPCIHRELQKPIPCPNSGRIRNVDFCKLKILGINPRFCNVDCTEKKE